MVNGKQRLVNSKFLLQFTINDLPFNFYEVFLLFIFYFLLFTRPRVSSCRRASFYLKQTRFDKRRSADKSADAAVETVSRNDLDEF